jgi:hypothetical protein
LVEASKGASALNTPKGAGLTAKTPRTGNPLEERKAPNSSLVGAGGSSEDRLEEQIEDDSGEGGSSSAKSNRGDHDASIVPPLLSYKQKCLKHQLLIHSYLRIDSKDLLCTKCIYERNLQLSQIEIVPSVVRDIKESIE